MRIKKPNPRSDKEYTKEELRQDTVEVCKKILQSEIEKLKAENEQLKSSNEELTRFLSIEIGGHQSTKELVSDLQAELERVKGIARNWMCNRDIAHFNEWAAHIVQRGGKYKGGNEKSHLVDVFMGLDGAMAYAVKERDLLKSQLEKAEAVIKKVPKFEDDDFGDAARKYFKEVVLPVPLLQRKK